MNFKPALPFVFALLLVAAFWGSLLLGLRSTLQTANEPVTTLLSAAAAKADVPTGRPAVLESLVNSLLPQKWQREVADTTVPAWIEEVVPSIESALSLGDTRPSSHRPCGSTGTADVSAVTMLPENGRELTADKYYTEDFSAKGSASNPSGQTFLYVPAVFVRGDPTKSLPSDDIVFRDIERTRGITSCLVDLTKQEISLENSITLKIIQAFVITVRGVARLRERGIEDQRGYYSKQFGTFTYFADRPYFKNTIAQNPLPWARSETGTIRKISSFFTVSAPYIDLGGNGIVITICRRMKITQEKDSVLCMDLSFAEQAEPQIISQLKEHTEVLQGTCHEENDRFACDKSFGRFQQFLEADINNSVKELRAADIFGNLKIIPVPTSDTGGIVFTLPLSQSPGEYRNERLLLCQIHQPHFAYGFLWFSITLIVSAVSIPWGLNRIRANQLAQRNRIAESFHDTLLQDIVAIILRREMTANLLPSDPVRVKKLLEDELKGLRRVVARARRQLRHLRINHEWSTSNLARAFERVGDENDSDLRLLVNEKGPPLWLQRSTRDSIYRIGREAFLNAVRHSGATEVRIELEWCWNEVRLQVLDNGSGVDTEVLDAGLPGHFGLQNMRTRAEHIGAQIDIFNSPKGGIILDLQVPIRDGWVRRVLQMPGRWLPRLLQQ